MNQQRLIDLSALMDIYKGLSKGESNRSDSTDDIYKALNKLEGIILVQINQLEQP